MVPYGGIVRNLGTIISIGLAVNNNNNNQIYIAPCGRNFRGAVQNHL